MQEPGLDKHEWESEWAALEPLVDDSPGEALHELDDLVARMLEARGFELAEREGEDAREPETTRDFAEARRITRLVDAAEDVDPGDIALAVNAYRDLYDYLLGLGPA